MFSFKIFVILCIIVVVSSIEDKRSHGTQKRQSGVELATAYVLVPLAATYFRQTNANAIVHFDLGCFSYNRRALVGDVQHYVSVHVIPDQGILYYDSMSQYGD